VTPFLEKEVVVPRKRRTTVDHKIRKVVDTNSNKSNNKNDEAYLAKMGKTLKRDPQDVN
jgi:hypothetical protein